MEYRNPRFNRHGLIDVDIEHPIHGWIPFSIDPNDTGAQFDVAALDAEIRASGRIAPYIAPPPPPPPPPDPIIVAIELLAAELPPAKVAAIRAELDKARQR